MRKIICILLGFCILASCTDIKRAPAPEPLYSQQKMADILTDIFLLESAISANKEAYQATQIAPTDFVYRKHKTDSLAFAKNLYYYLDRTKEYQSIIERVERNIEALKDSVALRQERLMDDKKPKVKVPTEEVDPEEGI